MENLQITLTNAHPASISLMYPNRAKW